MFFAVYLFYQVSDKRQLPTNGNEESFLVETGSVSSQSSDWRRKGAEV
jgi:hypothetical protein